MQPCKLHYSGQIILAKSLFGDLLNREIFIRLFLFKMLHLYPYKTSNRSTARRYMNLCLSNCHSVTQPLSYTGMNVDAVPSIVGRGSLPYCTFTCDLG